MSPWNARTTLSGACGPVAERSRNAALATVRMRFEPAPERRTIPMQHDRTARTESGAVAARTHGTPAAIDAATIQTLRDRLRGALITPGDEGYQAARQVWNGLIDCRPSLIARCTGVADVIEAVAFAREHELLLAVRGGGHGVAGHGVCDGGLVVDLSTMKGVQVDPAARTVRAQAGVTWGELDRETQVFGLATPGGVVSTTGIAGLTLGGGYSWQRRKHGMSIDNLLSVDLVTADGRFLRASETEDPDLFWALRGGGGNFGVATAFEFRLHPLGPEVMFLACLYPLERIRTVMTAWRDFIATAPDEATVDVLAWSIPAHPAFPEGLHGQPIIGIGGMYAGQAEEGERLFRPLRALAEPLLDMSGRTPYAAVQAAFDPFFPPHALRYYWKSSFLDSMSDEVIDAFAGWTEARSSTGTLLSLRHLEGVIGRVAADATAFGDRSAPFLLSIDTTWVSPDEDARHIDWTRDVWSDMQRFSRGGMYFNFPGFLEEGEVLLRNSFGANYDRLRTLKARYDPTNLFRRNQNISPAAA
jgi:FAD/FMN-containing dehydrogenase